MGKRKPNPSALGYKIEDLNDYADLMGLDRTKFIMTVLTTEEVDMFSALKRAQETRTMYDSITQETLLKAIRPEVYKANWNDWIKPVCKYASPL